MNPLDPVAGALLEGRSFVEGVAVDHLRHYGQPMIRIARAQTMRSVVQALVLDGQVEGFTLIDSYLAFGRVEVVQEDIKQHFLLKARSALPVETYYQFNIFDEIEGAEPGIAPLNLLLYAFGIADLTLATVPVEHVRFNGRLRFQLLGEPADIGTWSSITVPDAETFDQGEPDDFGDLSDGVEILGEDAQ